MARLVHGCPSPSFSRSKSPSFVCWCLSILVIVCEGRCSRCCSCCTLLVCLARAMASHYEDEPQGTYPSKLVNLGRGRFYGFEWLQNLKMLHIPVSLLFGMLDYHCSPDQYTQEQQLGSDPSITTF